MSGTPHCGRYGQSTQCNQLMGESTAFELFAVTAMLVCYAVEDAIGSFSPCGRLPFDRSEVF
jgi:hypothetical protein